MTKVPVVSILYTLEVSFYGRNYKLQIPVHVSSNLHSTFKILEPLIGYRSNGWYPNDFFFFHGKVVLRWIDLESYLTAADVSGTVISL